MIRRKTTDPEIDVILEIQIICRSARASAHDVAQATSHLDHRRDDAHRLRYSMQKVRALELTKTIADDFYRAVAFRQIIALCAIANDADARSFLREIKIDFFRDKVVEAHPGLLVDNGQR